MRTANLMEVCRCCMDEDETSFNLLHRRQPKTAGNCHYHLTDETQTIDNECTRTITIMELLKLTIPGLTIAADDMLPKKMCGNCLEQLLNIQEFRKMCIRVELRLQDLVMERKNPDVIDIIDPLNNNGIHQSLNLKNAVKVEIDESQNVFVNNTSQCSMEICKNDDWTDCSYDGVDEPDDADYRWEEPDVDNYTNEMNDSKVDNADDITLKAHNESRNFQNTTVTKVIFEEKTFACDECSSRLKTRKSLKRHKRIHLRPFAEKDHTCQYCKKVFQKLCSLKNHLRSHRDDQNREIEECTDSSNGDDDADCEWESRAYETGKELKNKRSVETIDVNLEITEIAKDDNVDKPFVCGQCGSRLKTRKSLKRHLRIHLRQPGEKEQTKVKYECEHCQKVFQQSSSLKDHLRVHTGEQPYLCSECGKAFKSLSNLKQHFLRHGTDRPYECPSCPKKFPCLSDLASHKAVHSKTKSHVCDVCGAGFVKPYLLKKHKMYHNGEKNHKCDYCDMRFVLADQCRRHMRTHTGEKPYKCKYCIRAFAQSNDLIKHLRSHLGENVYKCDMCPQGFRLQGDLRTHFNTHKNDDNETRLRNLQALREDELQIQMKFGIFQGKEQQ